MASPENEKLIKILWKNHPGESSYEAMKDNVDKMRENMVEMTKRFVPADDSQIERIDADGVPGEFVRAAGTSLEPVVLYLHGGGYVIGSTATHRGLVDRLSRACGGRILSLDYRLAPENPFPAALEDATGSGSFVVAGQLRHQRAALSRWRAEARVDELHLAPLVENRSSLLLRVKLEPGSHRRRRSKLRRN